MINAPQNSPSLEYGFIPISAVKENARNARTHNKAQIEKLAKSIEKFGFINPIIVDKTHTILAGHGRLAAAKVLSLPAVPYILVDHLTDEQARAYVLADNRIALDAGWNNAMLKVELTELSALNFDMDLTGFGEVELSGFIGEPGGGEGAIPALPEKPVSKPGDMYQLGEHRLRCGDSTKPEDWALLMAGQQAQLMWTDPPYNVNYEGRAGKIQNDSMSDSAFLEFLSDFHAACFPALAEGAAVYVAHADTEGLNFRRAFLDSGLKLSGCLIWRKPSLVLGRSDYQWQHEPILYGWKLGAPHKFYGGRKQTTLDNWDNSNFFQPNEDGSVSFVYDGRVMTISGDNLQVRENETTVFTVDKPTRSDEHPTMKPVELIERHLRNSSQKGDIVIDAFGGSGSTLIACEKIGRKCCMMELDPKFVDVIVKRWENLTGQKAELING